MSKKSLLIIALQVIVVGVFALIAAGSGSDGAATRSNSVLRAGAQGGICGANGYTLVTYCSNSECPAACKKAGYSAYCTGDSTTACFCK